VRETIKTAVATAIAAITVLFQCVLGYTNLGARIGIARIGGILGAALTAIIVILLWEATVDLPRRRRAIMGISSTFGIVSVTLALLWLTYNVHSILIEQTRQGDRTVTTFRGALTRAEATISFYTAPPVPITLRGIDHHDNTAVNAARVEYTSDTDFLFHAFQYPQRVSLTHSSTQPLHMLQDTDNTVGFTTPEIVNRQICAAAIGGGIAWTSASFLIWWLSRSARPSDTRHQAGFRTKE